MGKAKAKPRQSRDGRDEHARFCTLRPAVNRPLVAAAGRASATSGC
jgi:hypothetical protein